MSLQSSSQILQPELDAQVRRVDENRWLASRFAPAPLRARLITLYALNDELARAAEAAKEPALADIRLAWWREAVSALYRGGVSERLPVLDAFAAHREEAGWAEGDVQALIEARHTPVGMSAFDDWDAFDEHLDASAGRILRLALQACGLTGVDEFSTPAGRAWGAIAWARAGREPPADATLSAFLARALEHHRAAKAKARALPADAFPAFGYLSLAPGYTRALARNQRETPLLLRQVELVRASATGRL